MFFSYQEPNEGILANGTGMKGFWLPAQEWKGSRYQNGMEEFCRHRNGGVIANGTERRDSDCRRRNGGILAAGTGMEGFYSYRNGMEGF